MNTTFISLLSFRFLMSRHLVANQRQCMCHDTFRHDESLFLVLLFSMLAKDHLSNPTLHFRNAGLDCHPSSTLVDSSNKRDERAILEDASRLLVFSVVVQLVHPPIPCNQESIHELWQLYGWTCKRHEL